MTPMSKNPALVWFLQVNVINLIFALVLLISAGDLHWIMAWIYIAWLVIDKILLGLLVIRHNPDLARERVKLGADPIAPWDRRLAGVMAFTGPILILLIAGLDRRFDWTVGFPLWLQFAGQALIILGTFFVIWTMSTNRFFFGRVRVEPELGHTVVSTGPYAIIRHPGYAAGCNFYLSTALTLGSLWALIPEALTIWVTIIRTSREDQLLQERLEGYKPYSRQVRYRLLPGIW